MLATKNSYKLPKEPIMTKLKKSIKWMMLTAAPICATFPILYLVVMGGCPATETSIRDSLKKTLDAINARPELIELNRMSPLDQGAKVITVHVDNKMFGYAVEAELSNGSSIYLKLNADWNFCIPSGNINAGFFINEATSEPLKLPPEPDNKRQTNQSTNTIK